MQNVIVLLEDEHLINRIRVTLHSKNANYLYMSQIDEAVSAMEEMEVAVAILPYHLDVLHGDELIEIFLDHNPKIQIILLFEEEDLLSVVKTHNEYHLCKLIDLGNPMFEELPKLMESAFYLYNKDDELKDMEISYRKKEDRYKKTMFEMSSLLNDRTSSYKEIRKLFCTIEDNLLNALLKGIGKTESEHINSYFDYILEEYINLQLLRDPQMNHYFDKLLSDYHKCEEKRYLQVIAPDVSAIPNQCMLQVAFILSVISYYFFHFYDMYRGKIEVKESGDYYSVNIVYEGILNKKLANYISVIQMLNEKLVHAYTYKAAYGTKGNIMQYKMLIKKETS